MSKNIDKVALEYWKRSYLFWKESERHYKRMTKISKGNPTDYEKYIKLSNNSREQKISAKLKLASTKKGV